MKIQIVGGGAREHALCWALAQSSLKPTLICAPGNPGIAALADVRPARADDIAAQVALAQREQVDLVVVGPEVPLALGIADALLERGIAVFGPERQNAQLESSKIFAKEAMARAGVPTAEFAVAETMAEVDAAIARLSEGGRVVVKADGLAAGKGVAVASTRSEAIEFAAACIEKRQFGDAGKRLIIERCIAGREASLIAICDGERYALLAPSEDHKAVFDGDLGPNTGGMGVVSPTPALPDDRAADAAQLVIAPLLAERARAGFPYSGVLFAGLMISKSGLNTLEYNVRFGDPETTVQLLRARGDLAAVLRDAAKGALDPAALTWDRRAAVSIVLASHGYPSAPRTGDAIDGLTKRSELSETYLFHAGTAKRGQEIVTAGGRVLTVCATGDTVEEARKNAYARASQISFDGVHFRKDIGARG